MLLSTKSVHHLQFLKKNPMTKSSANQVLNQMDRAYVSCNLGQNKGVKIKNLNFAYFWTNGTQNGYSDVCKGKNKKK